MSSKIVVGPINRGLRNDRTAFTIDNDSFPVLINAYQWRGRVKRKRGTSLLTRLRRFFNSNSTSYNSGSSTILLNGSGQGNILTGFSLETNAGLSIGSITIVDIVSAITYTDPAMNGKLSPSGNINYASGAIAIAAAAGHTVRVTFNYYPNLPVMGLEDLILTVNQFPGTLGFDTKYSYNINTAEPYPAYDVSFYKNPATGTSGLPAFVQKTNWTPTTWNGQDYQQFWTVNYAGALWATNGINIPFSILNIGMQFNPITNISINAAGPPAILVLTIVGHGLVVGDFLFINEVQGNTGVNYQTGYVTIVLNANSVTVEFPNATVGGVYSSGGIAQYLTNRSDITKDCLRWYDGDPTNGSITNPILTSTKGWVNFAPPLSQNNFSISDLPASVYYLVGARMILPFKDRLLFFGPVVQTSAAGSQIYLQDTVIFSQNGTPYYTCSYTNNPNAAIDSPTSPTNNFSPILVPTNQTATSPAYFEDSTGFGGSIPIGIDQPITSVAPNRDVLILGLDRMEVQMVYTGSDEIPFNFFAINSDLGSSSTFSSVIMDNGVISRGNRGFIVTNTSEVKRIDAPIPDEVFEMRLTDNGTERFCSQRDYINEWIYFSYPADDETQYKFPTQTLQYNYRDDSWALFRESYTTYGQFRKSTGFTWATVGEVYPTWASWNDPWNAGVSNLLQPEVIAGNQDGFVLTRADGTNEGNSLYIKDFDNTINLVTSPDHCLNEGDYIFISGALGLISNRLNNKIYSVNSPTKDTFKLNSFATGSARSYLGGGLIQRMYVPFIQTMQFPVSWGMGRKTRLGAQQYLFTSTDLGQIQLLIFLSENGSNPYNKGTLVPGVGTVNNSLIYSTTLYTCPESTNLGLTPANMNLQTPTAIDQDQIWHRMNTSLIGDTVQIGFTMSDEQMRAPPQSVSFAITGATNASPCVLTCNGQFETDDEILITGVVGMTELNNGTFRVISSTSTLVTINIDSTSFAAYVSGGTASQTIYPNQFAEIELHGFILNTSPSQMLV